MVSLPEIAERRAAGELISMTTAYDATMARLVDESAVDIVLVGDSLGVAALGYDDTTPVTVDQMVHHTTAVTRVVDRAVVVADLPFGSYTERPAQAVMSATRLVKEGGADAVKLEGGREIADTVSAVVDSGVPVFGHLEPGVVSPTGSPPHAPADVDTFRDAAVVLDDAGVSGIVLKNVPADVATDVTGRTDCVTVGVGSGDGCDGQVRTFHDLLGLSEVVPDTTSTDAPLGEEIVTRLDQFHDAVVDSHE